MGILDNIPYRHISFVAQKSFPRPLVALLLPFLLFQTTVSVRGQWNDDPAMSTALRRDTTVLVLESVITPDAEGGVYALWSEAPTHARYHAYPSGHYRIVGQRVSADGLNRWQDNGIALSDTGLTSVKPYCIPDEEGGLIACWMENPGYRYDIYGNDTVSVRSKRIDSSGTELWSVLIWDRMMRLDKNVPIAGDGQGGAYLLASLSDTVLYLQHVDAAGNLRWSGHGLDLGKLGYGGHLTMGEKALISDGAGGVIFSWITRPQKYFEIFPYIIHVQHLDSSGALLWGPGGSAVRTVRADSLPLSNRGFTTHLARDGAGGVLVAFGINDFWADHYEMRMQRLSPNGMRMWDTSGVIIGLHDELSYPSQIRPFLVPIGSGMTAILYSAKDTGHNTFDKFIQVTDTSGTKLWNNGQPMRILDSSNMATPIADGLGGLYIAYTRRIPFVSYEHNELRLQHYNLNGTPQWLPKGKAVSTIADAKYFDVFNYQKSFGENHPSLRSDGMRGLYLTWVGKVGSLSQLPRFDGVYLARLHPDGTLYPVEYASFSATLVDRKVFLEWHTASETNNYGFTIERQDVDASWEQIGFVAGRGTTTLAGDYRFVDDLDGFRGRTGIIKYRLRQRDYDGTESLSPVVEVSLATSVETFSLDCWPNPAREYANIRVAVREAGMYRLQLYDAMGRRVQTLFEGTIESSAVIGLPVHDLIPGMYFLVLKGRVGITTTVMNIE